MRVPAGRRVGIVFALCAVAILALATAAVRQVRQEAEETAQATLANVAAMTADQLAWWLQRRSQDLIRESRGGLANLLDRGGIRREEPWWSLMVHQVRVFQEISDFREVLVLDPEGRTVLDMPEGESGVGPTTRDLIARAGTSTQVVRSDFYRCPVCGRFHLEFAVALRGPEDQILGYLVARLSAEDIVFPRLLRWPTPAESAQILLFELEEDRALFLSPLRQRPDVLPGTLRLPLEPFRQSGKWQMTRLDGPWRGLDYRGEPVLSHVLPVRGTPWFLSAQMDRTEALAPSVPIQRGIVAIALLAIAFAGALALWIHRLEQARALQETLERERALREVLSESEAILQGIGDGVIATDREGRIRRINPVAAELTGWSPEEALGRPLGEVFRIRNEETGAPVEDPVSKVLATGRVVGLANHTALVARDGTERPIADSGSPVRDPQGDLQGVVLVFRDQTEQRARERQIREMSERFERFFWGLPQGAALGRLPPESRDFREVRWVAVNPALARLLGRTVEEVVDRRPDDLLEGTWSRWVQSCPHETGGTVVTFEEDWPLDPSRRVVVTLLRTGPSECAALFEDVTDLRRAEEERRRMEAVASQQQRLEAIGLLAAGVAHEINNPIQSISNYAEVLAGHPDQAHLVREFAPEILGEAGRIAEIVRTLLGIARQGSDAISSVHPARIWERALVLLHAMLRKDRIEVQVEAPEDLPLFRGRPTQVLQVLINLLVNARDALVDPSRDPDRPRRVVCRSGIVTRDGRTLIRFEVRDNGTGIPPELVPHLFEPFFTSKGRERGTGLGLWISRRLAEEQGGFLSFENVPGEGAAFFLDLPLEDDRNGQGPGGR